MTDNKHQITQFLQELRDAEKNSKLYQKLLIEREELEHYELELQKKIHCAHAKAFESSDEIPEENALIQLQKKKQQIDHRLDIIGENIEEEIQEKKANLLQLIFDSGVIYQNGYDTLHKELELNQENLEKLNFASTVCRQVEKELMYIKEMRQKIRTKGIFSYIFGTNPNVVITQHLKSIELLINNSLPYLENQENFADLREFLISLKTQTKSRWGFRTIDIFIEKNLQENDKIHNQIKTSLMATELQSQRLEASIDSWLNQFA